MMEKDQERSFFIAWSPALETAISYSWKRERLSLDRDLGRKQLPRLQAVERAHAFARPGVRRLSIRRNTQGDDRTRKLFDTPTCRWIPARTKVTVEYHAETIKTKSMPASIAEFDALARQTA